MENEIFVVVGESHIDYEGEYHWLVSAWYYKDDAETHAARLNERIAACSVDESDDGRNRMRTAYERLEQLEPQWLVVDPLARIGDDAPEYSVHEVALQPRRGQEMILASEKGRDATKSE